MIIKLGIVRDDAIVETQWFNSHTHVIVPMLAENEFQALAKVFQAGGPQHLAAMAPKVMQKKAPELGAWILKGWNEYLASIPPDQNPLFSVNGHSGLVLPQSVNRKN